MIWIILGSSFLILNAFYLFFFENISIYIIFIIIIGLVIFTYTIFILTGKLDVYLHNKERYKTKKLLKNFHKKINEKPIKIREVETIYNKILNVFDVHLDGGQSEIYEDIIFTNYFSYPDLKNQTPFHEVLAKLIQALEDEHKKHFKFIPVWNEQKGNEILFTKDIIPLWKENYKDTEFLFNENNYDIICEYLGRKPKLELIRDIKKLNEEIRST